MSKTIYVGSTTSPTFTFTESDIRSANITVSISLTNDELAIDTFVPTVYYAYYDALIWAPRDFDGLLSSDNYLLAGADAATDDLISNCPYATPIWIYEDSTLMGKFYIERVTRKGRRDYQISCISAIGLLDNQTYLGGIFTGSTGGDYVGDVIDDILDGLVTYTIDSDVSSTYIAGWIPVCTRREALHQVLFAYNVTLLKAADGSLEFVYLDDTTTVSIPDSRIYVGGSVEIPGEISAVEVTEHTFSALSGDTTQTLFDNTSTSVTANNLLVIFGSAPCHDLATTGTLTISSSGVNWAIVNGLGTLTGQVYTHSTNVITEVPDSPSATENIISVSDATLITLLNSQNVADRLCAYYSSHRTVKNAFVLDGEECGNTLSFTNPYEGTDSGYLTQMQINLSSVNKANAEIITNYAASGFGNYYTRSAILTGSGTWTAPSDVKDTIRVVCIGGGTGGTGGTGGQGGGRCADRGSTHGAGGAGGAGGAAGSAGKVYSVELSATAGQSFSYSCGSGGAGGAGGSGGAADSGSGGEAGTAGSAGSAGTATTFGSISSASGATITGGVLDLIGGGRYGQEGSAGGAGGDGGGGGYTNAGDANATGDSVTVNGTTWAGGTNVQYIFVQGSINSYYCWYFSGGGSGAAYGKAGNSFSWTYHAYADVYTPNPANGVSPATPAKNVYGGGGQGGYGGSGGGGGAYIEDHESSTYYWYAYGVGSGGAGGTGGTGGDGCVIIYY